MTNPYAKYISEQVNREKIAGFRPIPLNESSHRTLSTEQKAHMYGALNSHIKADGDEDGQHHTDMLTHLDNAISTTGSEGSHSKFDALPSKTKDHLFKAFRCHKRSDGGEDDDIHTQTLTHMDKAADLT